jgi:hypothetical protein
LPGSLRWPSSGAPPSCWGWGTAAAATAAARQRGAAVAASRGLAGWGSRLRVWGVGLGLHAVGTLGLVGCGLRMRKGRMILGRGLNWWFRCTNLGIFRENYLG